MGAVPPKSFIPSSPYGSSQASNTLLQARPAAMNAQQPLLPPNFFDPGQQFKPLPGIPKNPLGGGGAGSLGGSGFGHIGFMENM